MHPGGVGVLVHPDIGECHPLTLHLGIVSHFEYAQPDRMRLRPFMVSISKKSSAGPNTSDWLLVPSRMRCLRLLHPVLERSRLCLMLNRPGSHPATTAPTSRRYGVAGLWYEWSDLTLCIPSRPTASTRRPFVSLLTRLSHQMRLLMVLEERGLARR